MQIWPHVASDLGLDAKYQVSKISIQATHCKGGPHHPSLIPSTGNLGPGQRAVVGEGRGDQGHRGRWSWGFGQCLRWRGVLRGAVWLRRGKSAPKSGQTKLPLGTYFIRGNQAAWIGCSRLCSPTQPHREAVNTQMEGLTLHVVSGTL